jgi:hypothetical protein
MIFSVSLIHPAALGPWHYSASNISEYQKYKMFLGSRAWPARKADNLTAICEPIVLTMLRSSTTHKPIGLHSLLRE